MLRILIFLLFLSFRLFADDLPFIGGGPDRDGKFVVVALSNQKLFDNVDVNVANVPVAEIRDYTSLNTFEKLQYKITKLLEDAKNRGQLPKRLFFKIDKSQGKLAKEEKEALKNLCKKYGVKFVLEYPDMHWKQRLNRASEKLKNKLKKIYPGYEKTLKRAGLGLKNFFTGINDGIFKTLFGKFYKKPTKREALIGFTRMAVVVGVMSTTLPYFKEVNTDSWVFWALATDRVIQEMIFGVNAASYVEFLNNNKIVRKSKGIAMSLLGMGIGFLALLPGRAIDYYGGVLAGDPLLSFSFLASYLSVSFFGFFSSYLPMGIYKLAIKRWVKRSTGTNIMQGLDSAMSLEGFFMAANSSESGNLFLKMAASVFAVHNIVKTAVALIGNMLGMKRFPEDIVILPKDRFDDPIFWKNYKAGVIPPKKDFFRNYADLHKFLQLPERYTEQDVQQRIDFLVYANHFLLHEKSLVKANKCNESLLLNIIRAAYETERELEESDYKAKLQEFLKSVPAEYQSPLNKLKNDPSSFFNIVENGCY